MRRQSGGGVPWVASPGSLVTPESIENLQSRLHLRKLHRCETWECRLSEQVVIGAQRDVRRWDR